mmetsp:Transcript_56367/g.82738  ORF Transcript_56367/g.82738 Transcript_56367/m.82738 type:complete len:90 (-) Transcript_56367:139-408(-)
MEDSNARVLALRGDVEEMMAGDESLQGTVRLSLAHEGLQVTLKAVFKRPSEWTQFCDKEAQVVLTIRLLMARHGLHFASHPTLQVAGTK